jgi:hypothetical protein
MCAFGEVTYDDAFGKHHWTRFFTCISGGDEVSKLAKGEPGLPRFELTAQHNTVDE